VAAGVAGGLIRRPIGQPPYGAARWVAMVGITGAAVMVRLVAGWRWRPAATAV
jgi:hypothetical protein